MTAKRGGSATLRRVPRRRNEIPDAALGRLIEAAEARAGADAELRAAVLGALIAGGSVREVARVARISTATVQAWKAEADQ